MDSRRCYICLTTIWRNGKVRTVAKQIDGLALPQGTCCVHALPASSSHQALSEEALAKIRKQHERGLERGSGRCLENVRGDLEATFRKRRLPVLLISASREGADEHVAVASTSQAIAGKDVQSLTSAVIFEELNRHLPGHWVLEHGDTNLQASTWRLRDALAPPPWGAKEITLRARLLPDDHPGTTAKKKNVAVTDRSRSLRETHSKVEALRRGTQGTPEADNAERVLKKLKTLMHQEAQ